MYKCKYGECACFNERTGECGKQKEIAALSTVELAQMMVSGECHLKEKEK